VDRTRLGPQPRWSRQDAWLVLGLLLVAVVLPLVVGLISGSQDIPRNDDWSYRRMAVGLAQTGAFALDGISETMIVGQILFAQPLLWIVGQQAAFTVGGVLFATGGILSAFWLARHILPSRDAAIAAGMLALVPGYLVYATSFMSDVPALAAQFVCLGLGATAIARRPVGTRWLIASAIVGVLAFSIREFAIAAPACVLLAAVVAEPRRLRTWAIGFGVAGACVALHLWHSRLPGQLPPIGAGYGSFSAATQAFTSVAFVIVPAALLGSIRWRRHFHRFDLFAGSLVGGILVLSRLLQWARDGSIPPMILDNLASQWGAPASSYLVGGRPLLFTDPVWAAVGVLALASSVIVLVVGAGIAGAHLRRCRRSARVLVGRVATPQGIVAVFVVAVLFGLIAFGLSRPIFDRYFWPVVPPLAALFLFLPADLREGASTGSAGRFSLAVRGAASLCALVLAVVSMSFLLNSASFDAARWTAGQRLMETGLRADQIDAGYEWVGYHATTQGDPTLRTSTETFYGSWWPAFQRCGLVTSDPTPPADGRLIGTLPYQLNLVTGPTEVLYLFRVSGPGCPPG